jgi:hypothetical protein
MIRVDLKKRGLMAKARQFLNNKKGEQISVVLDIEEYRKILEDLEELESIRAFDAAKASKDAAISFRRATREVERSRK